MNDNGTKMDRDLNRIIKFFAFLAVILLFVTIAEIRAFSDEDTMTPPTGKNTALDQALKECSESVGTDGNGRPDMTAMDKCMSEKGFTKPAGKPPRRGMKRQDSGDGNSDENTGN
jgi:hypothetical protein